MFLLNFNVVFILLVALSYCTAADNYPFIEQSFEEFYTTPTLNMTRWMPYDQPFPIQFDQAQKRWTMGLPEQFEMNVELPNYPIPGERGWKSTLSQVPCRNNQTRCCSGSKCANWAAIHLQTVGCLQYGALEWEAAIQMSTDSVTRHFFTTYLYSTDNIDNSSTTNEIDVGFYAGYQDYAGKYNEPTYSVAIFAPKEFAWDFNTQTKPQWSADFGVKFHNYTVLWTATTIAFYIDGTLYISAATNSTLKVPDRCQSSRFLMRTDEGSADPAGDSFVWLRRFKYTTLDDLSKQGGFKF